VAERLLASIMPNGSGIDPMSWHCSTKSVTLWLPHFSTQGVPRMTRYGITLLSIAFPKFPEMFLVFGFHLGFVPFADLPDTSF
jgi:hypothetical protein